MADYSKSVEEIQQMIADNDAKIQALLDSTLGKAMAKEGDILGRYILNLKDVSNKELKNLEAITRNLARTLGANVKEVDKVVKEVNKEVADLKTKGDVSGKAATVSILNALNERFKNYGKNGDDKLLNNSARYNKETKAITKEADKASLSRSDSWRDKASEKIVDFMGGFSTRTKKFTRDFITDLENSRLVKGGIADTVKLLSFFVGSWFAKFGTLGRVIGAGIVIAAPALANLIIKGISGALNMFFTKLVPFLAKGAWAGAKWTYGASSKTLAPNLLPASTAGKIGMGAGLIGGGIAAGAWSAHEWKQGNKGTAVAAGIGSAGLGVAGMATMFAPLLPVLAPIAPIALAIGGIAIAVGLIVKFWKPMTEWIKSIAEKLGLWHPEDEGEVKVKPLTTERKKEINDELYVQRAKGGLWNYETGQVTNEDLKAVETYGKLKVNKYGGAINLKDLTRKEAEEGFRSWYSTNFNSFSRKFTMAGTRNAQKFSNDVQVNTNGERLTPIGKDVYQGYIDMIQLTGGAQISGGLGTMNSVHKKPKSPQEWMKSHYGPEGLTMDLGLATNEQFRKTKENWNTIKKYWADRGFTATYEGDNGAKNISQASSKEKNSHIHIQPASAMRTVTDEMKLDREALKQYQQGQQNKTPVINEYVEKTVNYDNNLVEQAKKPKPNPYVAPVTEVFDPAGNNGISRVLNCVTNETLYNV